MADEITQPHDRLFRAVFSDTAEAASLLQTALPTDLRNSLDWPTLTLRDGTFLDDDLRGSESDLLYQIEHAETHEPVSLYLLFEHQSSPDRWMRLRLLRYCCRIWEDSFRDAPAQTALRPIVSVVFYQGLRRWGHSTELADLFPETARSWPWVPRLAHVLLDQTHVEPGSVTGGLKGRIAQLLMMAAFRRHVRPALELAARLVALLPAGGVNELRQFVMYVMTTQESEAVTVFGEALRRHGRERRGDAIMSYAQQLLEEGEAKGRAEGLAEGEQRGMVSVVEGLLRVGVGWDVIEAATGLNESRFQTLRERLASGA